MNQWMKYLAVIVGVPALVFALALTAFSITTEQTGISGKQVYSYDTVTGLARMQVVIKDILVLAGGEHIGATEDEGYQRVRVHATPSARVTADTQIKASAGWVGWITCNPTDATATAGTIIIYDNTAESGTILQQWDVLAAAYTTPIILPIQAVASTGIYIGFTTTNDMACTVFYR